MINEQIRDCAEAVADLEVLLRHRLVAQPCGFEGFVWLVEPLEAHCLPVADRPDGVVPALDLNGACSPVSPHAARLGRLVRFPAKSRLPMVVNERGA